jgi:predicted amidohydrolase YtcJ
MDKPVDILIHNARVFTADGHRPFAEAVAVSDGLIAFAGSNQEALDWAGSGTRLIDGQQATLMPGFIDSHFHLLAGSIELGDVQLTGIHTLEGLTGAIRQFAADNPQHEWLVGRGLNYGILPDKESLKRHHLDVILADRPVILFAYDTHTAWANTLALQRAGILEGVETKPNSQIVMAEDGLANGELREPGAYDRVMDLVPPPDSARKRALLSQGLAAAAAAGITSVHNMDGDEAQLALYAALEDLGELTLRVYCPYSVKPETPSDALAEAAASAAAYQSEMVRGGCVKFFMDGVIESYTAFMLDEYPDRPGDMGGVNFEADHFSHMAAEADRLGLQIFVHAIGDGAVRRTLDSFETVRSTNGPRDSRHRVEHIELIHPDDLPRFAELGVIASMQPLHAPLTAEGIDIWPSRVGEGRWERSFAWRSMRQAGARLVFGSDWPVVSQDPLLGLHAALNRQPWAAGQQSQRLTLNQALVAYTRDAAFAEFQEHKKGQLKAGMQADMVLLSEDIFAVPAAEVDRIRPVLTMCHGRIVYEA